MSKDNVGAVRDVTQAKLIWLAVRRALFALIAGVDAIFGIETKHVTLTITEEK